MRKFISKLKTKNNKDGEEDEQEIKKYEEHLENSPYTYGLQDTDDLKKIAWWQYLIFDLRFRIVYALILAVILGIAVPIVIHITFYKNTDSTIYGSCLIKLDARFQCLVNNVEPATRKQCVDANCCWEENEELPFKCFHSFPSAYQYTIQDVKEVNGNDTLSAGVQLSISPNDSTKMKNLTVEIKWVGENHLNLQIFNPVHYPERQMNGISMSDKPRSMESNGIIINFGDKNSYFFIQIVRNGSNGNETLFDTRLGPVNTDGNFISFTTTLPTPYFYGLTGGEGIGSKGTFTYPILNGFKNSETPFYMALENSNLWHGVLLETSLPFISQVLQAPGIGFHIESYQDANVNLQFFIGPTQSDVLQQLHSYIIGKERENDENKVPDEPYIGSYWGLGLHLCRALKTNASSNYLHILELNNAIPFDSDCIDSEYRKPFGIDYENFPDYYEGDEHGIVDIVDFLINNASKKIVLSQKVAIPWETETDISEIEEFLLMDKTNKSQVIPFKGMIDNFTVIYPDMFHPNIFKNLSLWQFDFGYIPVSGLILVDNFPKNEAIGSCKKPETYLQSLFQTSNDSSSSNGPWGSVCPEIKHTITVGENGESRNEKTHLELHNAYGETSTKKFRTILLAETDPENGNFLLSTTSGFTSSLYYSAQNGMEVDFSWVSLRESLASILRHFILSPISSTPVCGSFLPNETTSSMVDNNLCLRWYQLSLILPFTYHNYAHGNISRGPLDFPKRYQDYLKEAIRQKYTYAPYYYTLLTEYQQTFVPMITPMSFFFYDMPGVERSVIFKLLDQFMIGKSVLAAPIVKPELNRETYFPRGIWYDSDGTGGMEDGGFKTVTGFLSQTPLFFRGGHVIPILENPLGSTILESRAGNYTLLVALMPNGESTGVLRADNGLNGTEAFTEEILFEVISKVDDEKIFININTTITVIKGSCNENTTYSTTIDQVKFLGFPFKFKRIDIEFEEHPESLIDHVLGDELNYLRIRNIGMNWCVDQVAHVNLYAIVGD